jgi:uncharacterized SAM-binding protein YcdF (DUF218 family)
MPFVQVVKMEPTYQKQNGHENIVVTRWLHTRLEAIELLASLTQSTQNFVSPHPIAMRSSPHQCPTWHRSLRGQQAQVVPVPKALTAVAQGQ